MMSVRSRSAWASLSLVAMLALASLTVLPSPVMADYYNLPDQRGIQIYSESLDSRTLYAGDQNISFYVRVYNAPYDDLDDDNPIRHCNASFETVVRSMDGGVIDSPILQWDAQQVDNDISISDGSTSSFSGFQFDLRPECDIGTYNLTFCLRYENNAGTPAVFYSYVSFDISRRVTVSGVTGIYPGDRNRDLPVDVEFNMYTLEDTRLNIAVPDEDFSWFGSANPTASVFKPGNVYYSWEPHFTMSLATGKAPGTYETSYSFQCKNSQGMVCSERGEMEFEVGCLPLLETETVSLVLEQGAYDAEVPVLVTNVGNVNLYDVHLTIAEPSLAYVHQRADHYEGDRPIGSSRVSVGDIKSEETVGAVMPVVLDPLIPIGSHRVLVDVSGFYFDPIEGSHKVLDLVWTETSSGYIAQVDTGTVVITLSPERSSAVGPSFMLDVVDPSVDVTVECRSDVCAAHALESGCVRLSLENYGNTDYGDVSVCVETGTEGSPFVNHLNPTKDESEVAWLEAPLTKGQLVYVQVPVEMRDGTALGLHTVDVSIAMVDMIMGREVTAVMPMQVYVRGMGPLLRVTSVDPIEIAPGEDFTLSLTIANVGDDLATGVFIVAAPEGTGGGAQASELDGDVTPPEPLTLPVPVADIPPGSDKVVAVEMRSNPDMSAGHVYRFRFGLEYTDPYGVSSDGADMVQEVSVKAKGEGGSVQADLYSTVNVLAWVAMIAIIVLLVLFIVTKAWGMRGPRRDKGAGGQPPEPPQSATDRPRPLPPPPPQPAQPAPSRYEYGAQPLQPQQQVPQQEYPPPQS